MSATPEARTAVDIDVVLTPAALDPEAVKGRRVVVVDVLRASTTIVTALGAGARAIIPAIDTGEAGRLAATLDPDHSLLGGEREGVKVAGFGAGNSPAEYGPDAVAGKTVVLTTTNGTRALARAKPAARVAVGGFVNAAAAVAFLREGIRCGEGATVLCAGWTGRVSLEDTLAAGLLVSRLVSPPEAAALPDPARMAYALHAGSQADIERAVRSTQHARRLVTLGHGGDIARCAAVDTSGVLPVLRDGRITAA